MLRGQPVRLAGSPRGWRGEELLRDAEGRAAGRRPRRRAAPGRPRRRRRRPGRCPRRSTTSRCRARPARQRRVDRLDPARVDHGERRCPGGEQLGGVQAGRRPSRRRRPAARRAWSAGSGAAQHVHRRRARRPPGLAGRPPPLGKRTTVGPSSTRDRLASSSAQRWSASRGRGDPQPGHDLQDRHVPHAVVAGAVGAGDAGPVEHEGDRQPVQRDVHQHLVEGAVEEGRVDRDHRVQAAGGQPGRAEVTACCSAMPTS